MPAMSSEGFIRTALSEDVTTALYGCLTAFNTYMVRGADFTVTEKHLRMIFDLPARLVSEGRLPAEAVESFEEEMLEQVARLLAYNRDCREGKGERTQVYQCVYWLILEGYADEATALFRTFPSEYGYWGDFRELYCSIWKELSSAALSEQQVADLKNFHRFILDTVVQAAESDVALIGVKAKEGLDVAGVSLVGKWLPSLGNKHDKICSIAKSLASLLFPKAGKNLARKRYRLLCGKLRRELFVVEKLMSGDGWGDIDPSKVPAKAMRKYRLAYSNKKSDGSTRSEAAGRVALAAKLEAITAGTSDKTLKTAGLQFYELLYPYVRGEVRSPDAVLETQGRSIIAEMRKAVVAGDFPISAALVDVSGSMSGVPMEVAVAMGLLIANIMPHPWHGRVLTFESRPQWHRINTEASLFEQVSSLMEAPWGGSTNFTAAVGEVLALASGSRELGMSLPMPEFLFCFTDMQFDAADCRGGYGARGYGGSGGSEFRHSAGHCQKVFKEAGLTMPRIVFWNLRASDTVSFAAESTTPGVAMLSGFSQSAFKVFMKGADFSSLTPVSLMQEALMDPRYDVAAEAVRGVATRRRAVAAIAVAE